MSASSPKSLSALGFLTVIDLPAEGLIGGYLVLNMLGRPLEFHCTAPVRPNRAQEILYGPTLAPYLYGEQIGHTLVEQAKSATQVVCTDVEPALAVRPLANRPTVLLLPDRAHSQHGSETERTADGPQGAATAATTIPLIRFPLGSHDVAVHAAHPDDQHVVTEQLLSFAETWDLGEPFERIREALQEARPRAA